MTKTTAAAPPNAWPSRKRWPTTCCGSCTLSHLSERDRSIGAALIDALDEDGYLREPLSAIAETLAPGIVASENEILTVLHQIQRFDPVGIGATTLGECLTLQLDVLDPLTPGRELARRIAAGPLERLPRAGAAGLAAEFKLPLVEVEQAIALVRSLDPRPGKQMAPLSGRYLCGAGLRDLAATRRLARGARRALATAHHHSSRLRTADPHLR